MEKFKKRNLNYRPVNCLIIIFIAFFTAVPLQAGELIYRGLEAMGKGDYREAIKYYGQAQKENYKWDWLAEMIETTELRQRLGKIKPEYTQSICVIYITQIIYKSGKREIRKDVTD